MCPGVTTVAVCAHVHCRREGAERHMPYSSFHNHWLVNEATVIMLPQLFTKRMTTHSLPSMGTPTALSFVKVRD